MKDIRELTAKELPERLLEIPDPPERLWMRGSLPSTEMKYLAVVGSRASTRYGKEATAHLISGLAGYPISIISGLALGIDGAAHEAALAAGLHTIAVPGSGLDDTVLYPYAHRSLAKRILSSGGTLLSEHDAMHRARSYDFPSRNRIMVGLANAVLIIEAGERSGTLITARLASEYNRDLLCVPHRISDPHSFGAHLFLRLGATLVADSLHILEALNVPPTKPTVSSVAPNDLSKAEHMIYTLLEEPMARDELIRCTQLPAHEALTALVSLELRGVLKEEFGAWQRT